MLEFDFENLKPVVDSMSQVVADDEKELQSIEGVICG